MIKNERQKEILDILKKVNYATVEQLAEMTYSSAPTIRRELNYLQEKGYLIRNHGGATLPLDPHSFIPSDLRTKLYTNHKKAICREASKLITDHSIIFINDSSTVQHLIEHIKEHKNITVITNSLTACAKLNHYNINFYCTGGHITHANCFTGIHAEKFIRRFNADFCFFSSHGISENGMITANMEEEYLITSAMIEQAKNAIYLCDESKVGILANYNLTNVNAIDKVFTTASPDTFTIEDKSKLVYVPLTKLPE